MMIASGGTEGSEEGLRHISDSNNRSFLFRTSNDLMTSIIGYLGIEGICNIDISASNHRAFNLVHNVICE